MDLACQNMLGYNLKILRTTHNLSQSEVAKIGGITRSLYAQYELGNRSPDAQVLYNICSFFHIDMNILFEPTAEQFINHMLYSNVHFEMDDIIMKNYHMLSPFSKGRLIEYSERLLEWDKFKLNNSSILEDRKKAKKNLKED